MKRLRSKGGFTLIELLIVIIIIGILAAIAIPMFLNQRDKAKVASLKESGHSLQVGIQSYAVDNNDSYPVAGTDLYGVIGPGATVVQIDNWPKNAWKNTLLNTTLATEGEITYETSGTASYTLTLHGKDAAVVTP